MFCWNCILRQRLKLEQETCPYCKDIMTKVYISSDKDDTIAQNQNALCDPVYELYFEDVQCRNFIQEHIGFYCVVCRTKYNESRKFPSLEALESHMDKAHHSHFCNLCLYEKPVLIFEQTLFKWGQLHKHKDKEHEFCHFCSEKYYDSDSLYKHYRDKHYNCELCKK